jgi:hypothetical protein
MTMHYSSVSILCYVHHHCILLLITCVVVVTHCSAADIVVVPETLESCSLPPTICIVLLTLLLFSYSGMFDSLFFRYVHHIIVVLVDMMLQSLPVPLLFLKLIRYQSIYLSFVILSILAILIFVLLLATDQI